MKLNKKLEKNPQFPKYLLIGLITLQILILLAQMIAIKKHVSPNNSDNSSSFLPFWVAIFIPIITTIKKRRQNQEQSTTWLWILVGLASLVLITMVFFLLVFLR